MLRNYCSQRPVSTVPQRREIQMSNAHMRLHISVTSLVDAVAVLRGDGGDPWFRAQTHRSLAPHVVEETYELVEAIDTALDAPLQEELGDLLLQVVVHAQLAQERDTFDLADVCDGIDQKMRRRHAAIFNPDSTGPLDIAAAERDWARAKRAEGRGVVAGVPRALPTLMRADQISRRAAAVGFDWSTVAEVLDKLDEERDELRAAVSTETTERALEELGDLLFAAVNVARHLGGTADEALRGATARFEARLQVVEGQLALDERDWADCSPQELDRRWRQAKRRLAGVDEAPSATGE